MLSLLSERVHLQLSQSDFLTLKSKSESFYLDVNSFTRLLIISVMNTYSDNLFFDVDWSFYKGGKLKADSDNDFKSIFLSLSSDQLNFLSKVSDEYSISRSVLLRFLILNFDLTISSVFCN